MNHAAREHAYDILRKIRLVTGLCPHRPQLNLRTVPEVKGSSAGVSISTFITQDLSVTH